MKLKMQRWNSL